MSDQPKVTAKIEPTPLELATRAAMKEAALRVSASQLLKGQTAPTYFPLKYVDAFGDLLPLCVPHKPTKTELVKWNEAGFIPVWLEGSKRHPHGLLGAGRALAEQSIIRFASELAEMYGRPLAVADVGSNADRFHSAIHTLGLGGSFASIHHLIPRVQNGDKSRLLAARGKYEHCQHTFEECGCIGLCDVFVFQHSLYYFTPETLLQLIPDDVVCFASVHHIFDAAGSLCLKQLVYHIGDDGLADCKADGNLHHYVHPTNEWMKAGRFADGTGRVLLLEHLSSHFDSHVYRLWIETGSTESRTVYRRELTGDYTARIQGIVKAVVEDRSLGPLHSDSAVAHLEPLKKVVHLGGSALVYNAGNRVTAVPLDAIEHLQGMAAGVPRDPVLMRTLYEAVKRYLRNGNMPPERISRVATLAVCAALVRDVEQEAASIGRMYATHQQLFATHKSALSGAPVGSWRWFHWFSPNYWFRTCYECGEPHDTDEALAFHSIRSNGYAPVVAKPTAVLGSFPPTYLRKTVTPVPLAEGATCERGVDERPQPGDPHVILCLISVGAMMPTSVHNRAEGVVHALQTRILRQVPPSQQEAWQRLTKALDSPTSALYALRVDPVVVTPADFSRWLLKFPESDRHKFVSAIDELSRRDLTKEDFMGSVFLKVEKSGMVTIAGPPEIDERAIISYKPTVQAVTGPYDWLQGKAYRAALSVKRLGPLAWVNGEDATGENFGAAFTHAHDCIYGRFGKVWYQWGDNSKFEAHRDENSHLYCRTIKFNSVRDRRYRFAVDQKAKLRGRGQRHNVKYSVKWKLGSGMTDTSIDSMFRNFGALVHTFGEPTEGVLVVFFNGDDWLVISSEPIGQDFFDAKMLELGFESSYEASQDPSKIEFCQTLPWPTADGVVWGPKIGRVLARLPWGILPLKEDPRGVALGMVSSCSYIPFLRVYLERIIQLTVASREPVKAVRYEHHIAASWHHQTDDLTWAFCYDRYGLTQQDEIEFTILLDQADLKTAIEWRHFERIYAIDEC